MPAEIRPGVFLVEHEMLPGTSVAITLVVGERVALIDSGLATTPALHIFPALQALGLDLSRVAYIINTHGHGDHVQGNAALVQATGATVLAHGADVSLIEHPTPVSTAEYTSMVPTDHAAFNSLPRPELPPPSVGRPLKNGDTIDLGGRHLRVLHAPGHSAGAIMLVEEATGLVITGDALQGRGTTGSLGTYVPLIFDLPAYRQTLATALTVEADTVITSHAFRPATGPVLNRDGWQTLQLASAAAADEASASVIDILHQAGGQASLSHIAHGLCALFDYKGITTCSLFTTVALLEDLSQQGYVARPPSGGDGAWHLC